MGWLGCLGATAVFGAEPAKLRWLRDASPVAVEVTGAAAQFPTAKPAEILLVFAEQPSGGVVPPMAGEWQVAGGALVFTPRFPLMRGVRYRAEYRPPGAAPILSFFELPADRTAPTTTVAGIFPSAAVLPENQLKFYVQFSAPMSRGGVFPHIHIRDAAGAIIELPFLDLDEELWDLPMTRLTLLIDPGRIKRGVKPLEDVGPVFEAGKSYSLTVGAACRDAAGRPLRSAFEKRFEAGAADRTPPEPVRWKIRAPAAGTHDALMVEFDEPMEHALALRLIDVVAASDRTRGLDGEPTLSNQEREWRFVPAKPWRAGPHELVVATTIEDLAGNNIGKTFDVDVFDATQRRVESPVARVAFVIQ